MNFDAKLPIYIQIMDDFKRRIVKGEFARGNRIASVRDLAIHYGVNPNTVQRSLSELEREGLLYSERTNGRYITVDEDKLNQLHQDYADALMDSCIQSLRDLGMNEEAILELLKRRLQDGE